MTNVNEIEQLLQDAEADAIQASDEAITEVQQCRRIVQEMTQIVDRVIQKT